MPPRSTPMTQAAAIAAATIDRLDGRSREPPKYTKYRSRPKLVEPPCAKAGERRASLVERLRNRALERPRRPSRATAAGAAKRPGRGRITWKRVLKWVAVVVAALARRQPPALPRQRPDRAGQGQRRRPRRRSTPAGFPLTGASNILVLGSDTAAGGHARSPARRRRATAAATASCSCASAAARTAA